MPAGLDGVGFGELIVMCGFLAGLPPTVPTIARFVLWDTDKLTIPIQPRGVKTSDFPGAGAESTAE